ncbi:hypothetical protein DZ860_11735 [Vibrio sinensis]|uniref:Porin n=1 Tax=Vibrio sinensis TaxID=2302434 RepID=A0A3A6QF46_9VIBR|nr:outer membrane protein OmpK [Vibrio sinensis]RJX70995.1 hypothetical protein DZ860_11735 [Vibrio sinensis]
MKLKHISALALFCSASANALILPNDAKTLDRVSVYYMDWSEGATEQSQGFAFDTGVIQYSHAAIKNWGEWVAIIDASNFSKLSKNDYDDMESITVRTMTHKNLGDTNFNAWAQNTLATSTVMTANDLYVGISYDWNIGSLQLKPAIGLHHNFGMASIPLPTQPNPGMELAMHTDHSGLAGMTAVITAQYPFTVFDQAVLFNAGLDYQFARPDDYKEFVMVDRDAGYAAIINLDWSISQNLNAFIEYRYMNNYSVAMNGNAGGLAVGVGYSF